MVNSEPLRADPDFPAFQAACRELRLELTQAQYDRLIQYARMLGDWNTRINLISRRDTGRILTYHVLDSLAVQNLIPQGTEVCDVGTGAGLPGIPLALIRPDITVVLVESSQKKCLFLKATLAALELTNVEFICARSEELDPLSCDVVLSRLTGRLPEVLKHSAHHRKPDGTIILYKTRDCAAELQKSGRALARHHLRVKASHDVLLPLSNIPRRFVVLGS